MTDATQAPEPQDAAEATQDQDDVGDDRESAQDAPPEVAALRREAASRRRQLREVEVERDALRERVERMQRAEVERIATTGRDGLADARDFWAAADVDLADVLDDDGNIDAEKVGEARARVLSDRPHMRRPPTAADFDGGARQTAPPTPDFAGAMRRAAGAD